MNGSKVMLTLPHLASGHITVLVVGPIWDSLEWMRERAVSREPLQLALEEINYDGPISLEMALPGLFAHVLVGMAVALLDLHVGLVQHLKRLIPL